MKKRIDLNGIVVYNQKKRHPRSVIRPNTRSNSSIDEVVKKIDEPKAEPNQLTDRCGLDRSYDANNYISINDNTVYIAGTHLGRASDWYDDIFRVPSLWNAVPIVNQFKFFMLCMRSMTIYRRLGKSGS